MAEFDKTFASRNCIDVHTAISVVAGFFLTTSVLWQQYILALLDKACTQLTLGQYIHLMLIFPCIPLITRCPCQSLVTGASSVPHTMPSATPLSDCRAHDVDDG